MDAEVDLEPLKIDRGVNNKRSRRGPGRRWIVLVVVLVVVGGAGFFSRGPITSWVSNLRTSEVRAFKVVKRARANLGGQGDPAANGYIVAKTRAALSADTPGRIVELNVEEGSVVKRGDVVARLYDKEYAAAVRRTEAELAMARAAVERQRATANAVRIELEGRASDVASAEADVLEAEANRQLGVSRFGRVEKLVDEGIENLQRLDDTRAERDAAIARLASARARLASAKASEGETRERVAVADTAVSEAEANVDALDAADAQARATLEKTEVRAPFDGVVVLKDAEIGEVVSPNSQGGNSRGSVVTMVDFDSLEVQAEVPETSLSAVRIGGRTTVFLDAWPDEPYSGRVDRIWPTANRQKATVEVRVAFEERDARLRPELGVRVVFHTDDAPRDAADAQTPRITIPMSAVVRRPGETRGTGETGQTGVYQIEGDTVHFRSVVLGEERAGKFVVEQGLEGGETLVQDASDVSDGDRVRVRSN